jgi:hypothetical protein
MSGLAEESAEAVAAAVVSPAHFFVVSQHFVLSAPSVHLLLLQLQEAIATTAKLTARSLNVFFI